MIRIQITGICIQKTNSFYKWDVHIVILVLNWLKQDFELKLVGFHLSILL